VTDSETRQLQAALASLALSLFTERSLRADLQRLIRLTCRLIPDCSSGSIALLVDGRPTTSVVSDHVALELDLVQYDNDEGPCLLALGGETVRVGILAADERFPHFAVGAADQRVVSVLSKPIRHADVVIGTLNLYSRRPDGFDSAADRAADVFAAETANAIVKADVYAEANRVRNELQATHDATVQISRAEGALAAIQDCSLQQAHTLIERASAETGDSHVDVARRILDAVEQSVAD
jgi:GAF domain-containing protein